MPNALIVIPARLASTRLPGKMLLQDTGKFLLQHTYERALQIPSARWVFVATDSEEIAAAAREFNGNGVTTSSTCESGTHRVAEAVERLARVRNDIPSDVVVNIQGDEPEFDIDAVEEMIYRVASGHAEIATVASRILDENRGAGHSPDVVKVVFNHEGRAMYFSRSPIPYSAPLWQHVGVYAFSRPALLRCVRYSCNLLDASENLEQLRWLFHGERIDVVRTAALAYGGIDTQEDYDRFVARVKRAEETTNDA